LNKKFHKNYWVEKLSLWSSAILGAMTLSIAALSIMPLCVTPLCILDISETLSKSLKYHYAELILFIVMLIFVILNGVMLSVTGKG